MNFPPFRSLWDRQGDRVRREMRRRGRDSDPRLTFTSIYTHKQKGGSSLCPQLGA